MKKLLTTMYLVVALTVFFVGMSQLSAVAVEPVIIACATYFPGTCTQNGCSASKYTYADDCKLYYCYKRTGGYETKTCEVPPDEEPIEPLF